MEHGIERAGKETFHTIFQFSTRYTEQKSIEGRVPEVQYKDWTIRIAGNFIMEAVTLRRAYINML